MPELKVLVTDAETRKSFDLYNVYNGKYGFPVITCAAKDTGLLSGVYGQQVYSLRLDTYPNFEHDLNALSSQFSQYQIVYVPASEQTTLLFYRYIAENLEHNFKYILPQENTFQLTRNKFSFQQFCEKSKLPVPESFSFDVVKKPAFESFPLVLKPRIGAGSVGIKYLKTRDELSWLDQSEEEQVLIQKKITSDGTVEGAFFLCNEGTVVSAFSHRRIRTYPQNGGVTVCSESAINEAIIKIGSEVLKKLNWSGLAMIEFMYDTDTQSWKIIELNPRLWGSVLLSAFNGSNMLDNYVRLSASLETVASEPQAGRRIRWYYPYEILNFLSRKISFKEFVSLDRGNTCYINHSYATAGSALRYQLYLTFNMRSIKRFYQKTFLRA